MKGLAITSKGIEDTASVEIKELIGAKCHIQDCCVAFDFEKFEELCLLCYKSQSVDRIIYLIDNFEFEIKNFSNEFEKFFQKLDISEWIKKYKNFKVECLRIGQHDFKSVDAETQFAKFALKKYKNKNIKFNMKEYEIIFFIYIINNKCYFGIDFAGFELNKRAYKIFLHPGSLRGTIAYALIRESGFNKKGVVLDTFSRDGVIVIESAFYANNFPVQYFKKDKFAFLKFDLGINYEKFFKSIDKKIKKPKAEIYSFDHIFKYVDYCKKNAKIAGVDKEINFSRTELEWLDIKFKKETADWIITTLPISKNANLEKIYSEFFYQADYILKKDGRIAIVSTMTDFLRKHAEKHNFIVEKEKDVWSGEQKLTFVIFKKKSI